MNGGSVYIGGSYGIGNLQISGSFTQGQFGILHVRIGASGNHDILQVQADLALDGTVRVEILSGFQIGSFGFIEYSGNRNGTSFALIDPIGDAASYLWALDYGQNGIVNLVSQ